MADNYTNNHGTVYQFDLRVGGRGNVFIEIETIPHPSFGGHRPKKVWGQPVLIPSPGRDTSLLPIAMDDDDEAWSNLKEASFEGGHLVALNFGGPDHPYNIAPMTKGANSASGTWGAVEKAVKTELNALTMGQTVYLEFDIGYDNAVDPRIPSRIKGFVERRAGGHAAGPRNPINTYIGPPNDQTNCLTKPMITFFRDMEIEADNTGYATLLSTPQAPNAPLDVIDYKRSAASINLRTRLRNLHPLFATYPVNGIRKAKGKSVDSMQRYLMMFYNRFRNLRGPLKSAMLTAEDEYNLGLALREWQGQYDHTKPKSRGGKNTYGNLVFTHHRVNNKRGAGGTGLRYQFKRVRRKPMRFGFG